MFYRSEVRSKLCVSILPLLAMSLVWGCQQSVNVEAPSEVSQLASSEGSDAAQVDTDFDWSQNSDLTSAPPAIEVCRTNQCTPTRDYAWDLEREFWSILQNQRTQEIDQWIGKADRYINHANLRDKENEIRSRLSFLVAMSYSQALATTDFEPSVLLVNKLESGKFWKILSGIKDGLGNSALGYRLANSLAWLYKSHELTQIDAVKRMVKIAFMSVVSTLQAMAPEFAGMSGAEAVEATLYGPTCKNFPQIVKNRLKSICNQNGLIGPQKDSYLKCTSLEECRNVGQGHSETFFGGMAIMYKYQDKAMLQKLLVMGGDNGDEIAKCGTFWCRYLHPREPNAQVPEKTSLSPFKRIVQTLMFAETYGKIGEFAKMERALLSAEQEAKRLKFPFMDYIEDVKTSLKGGDASKNIPDLIQRWKGLDPEKDKIGLLSAPFAHTSTSRPCASCHFGGVLPREAAAIYGK